MTDGQVRVWPRQALVAERREPYDDGVIVVYEAWYVGEECYDDAEFAAEWVPAEIFDELLDAAGLWARVDDHTYCHDDVPGGCAVIRLQEALAPFLPAPPADGWMDGYMATMTTIVDHLNHAMTPRGVNQWLGRVHPFLNGKTPIEALADKDQWPEVISLAERTRSAP